YQTAATSGIRGSQVFTGNGTFTTSGSTLSSTQFKFTVVAGGGGGGGATSAINPDGAAAGGGGAGGTSIYWITGLSANQNVTVTVGGAGSAGSSAGGNGGTGGNSSVVVGA